MRRLLLLLLPACAAPSAGPASLYALVPTDSGEHAWFDVSWSGDALTLAAASTWPAVDAAVAQTACGSEAGALWVDGAGQRRWQSDVAGGSAVPLDTPDATDPLAPDTLEITTATGRFVQVVGALWGEDPRGGVLEWTAEGWTSAISDAWVRRAAELRAAPARQWLTPTALHALFTVPGGDDAAPVQRLTTLRLPTPEPMRTVDLVHAQPNSLTPIAWQDHAGVAWWLELERSVRDAKDTGLLYDAVLHRDAGGGWQEVDRILSIGQEGPPTERASLADTWASVPVSALSANGRSEVQALLVADALQGRLTLLRAEDVSAPRVVEGLDLCVVRPEVTP